MKQNKTIGDPAMCWICGRNGSADTLDRHHIFGGANRKNSEDDGLCVMLCHHDCHIFGPNSVHQNREVDLRVKVNGQNYAMTVLRMTREQFIARYGRNYIDDEYENGLDIWPEEDESA